MVDDDDSLRAFAAVVLQTNGFKVLEATNGLEALQVLEKHGTEVRVILTDVNMPGMDGITLAIRARELFPEIRIILMSGCPGDQWPEQPYSCPALRKPFRAELLLGTVWTALGQ